MILLGQNICNDKWRSCVVTVLWISNSDRVLYYVCFICRYRTIL